MKIAFLVERPTQFEAPFFRYAAGDSAHELRVLFTGTDPAQPAFDPELGRRIDWGIDLLGGYPHAIAPAGAGARWVARELARAGCDLLIANGYTRRTHLLAAALAKRARISTALRLDSVPWGGSAARRRSKRFLYAALLMRLYDLFLGVGSLSLDFLATCGVPAARQGLFPYAIDVERFRSASRLAPAELEAARAGRGIPPASRAVLALAKLNPREAPWDLLRAFTDLPPDTFLLVAGDGPERAALERLARELGPPAERRVRFLGYVPYAELPALYAACDLFVHAAWDERWGVSVAEALACGLPVVASSRVGAAYDLVAEGRNGWIYRSGDPAALARRIRQALALDRAGVAAASGGILARWDYGATWRHLLAAGNRVAGGASGAGGRIARGAAS